MLCNELVIHLTTPGVVQRRILRELGARAKHRENTTNNKGPKYRFLNSKTSQNDNALTIQLLRADFFWHDSYEERWRLIR